MTAVTRDDKQRTDDTQQKTALVIGGGGSKTAFAVGAIAQLREAGIVPDIVLGLGTGALIAPLVATNELDVLHGMFSTLEARELLRVNLRGLFWNSVYDTKPLARLLEALITEQRFRRLQGAKCRLLLNTMALQSGRLDCWSQRPSETARELVGRRGLIDVLLSSATQPLVMPPVQIRPDVDQHLHGGVADPSPLSAAISHGATTIYALLLSPTDPHPARQHFNWVGDSGWRFMDVLGERLLVDDLRRALELNKTLRYLETLEQRAAELLGEEQRKALFAPDELDPRQRRRPLALHLIHPERQLRGDGRDFTPGQAQTLMQSGARAAETALAEGPLTSWPDPPVEGW
jgi:predicted acylesterase/phospholipase RssA